MASSKTVLWSFFLSICVKKGSVNCIQNTYCVLFLFLPTTKAKYSFNNLPSKYISALYTYIRTYKALKRHNKQHFIRLLTLNKIKLNRVIVECCATTRVYHYLSSIRYAFLFSYFSTSFPPPLFLISYRHCLPLAIYSYVMKMLKLVFFLSKLITL